MGLNADGTPDDGSNFTQGSKGEKSTAYNGDGLVWNPSGGPDGQGRWEPPTAQTQNNPGAGPGYGPGGVAGGVNYNPVNGIASFQGNATLGKVSDPNAWGGNAGQVVIGPDGKPMVDTSQNGRAQDVDRLRGIGAGMANRAAPTMDFSSGDAARAQGLDTRAQQTNALSMLQGAAQGNAPSAAKIGSQGAADDGFAAQLGAGAGVRGGPTNQGAAAGAGQRAGAATGLGMAQAYGGARSSELTAARGAYATGAGNVRSGDQSAQNTDQARAKMKYENEIGSRKLNQAGQESMEDQAWNVNKYAQDAALKDYSTQTGQGNLALQRQGAEQDRMAQFYNQAISQGSDAGGKALGDK